MKLLCNFFSLILEKKIFPIKLSLFNKIINVVLLYN